MSRNKRAFRGATSVLERVPPSDPPPADARDEVEYTELEEVPALLQKRSELRHAIERWWQESGFGLPPYLVREEHALFQLRPVATWRVEDEGLHVTAQQHGLRAVTLERHSARVGSNALHRSYFTLRSINPQGGAIEELALLDRHEHVKKPYSSVKIGGYPLVAFHHSLRPTTSYASDLSNWLYRAGNRVEQMELAHSLAIAHGAIYQNWMHSEPGSVSRVFFQVVVAPAMRRLQQRFRVHPIYVRAAPWNQKAGQYSRVPSLRGNPEMGAFVK